MIRKKAKRIGQWGLVVFFILILLYVGDVSELSRVPTIHWTFVLLFLLSVIGFTLAHNIRWTAIVRAISNTPPEQQNSFYQLYQWLLNSYALGTILPSDISLAGLRTFYINRSQTLLIPDALFSVLLDRFFDVIIFLALAVPSALFITEVASGMEALFLFGCILAAIFLLICRKKGKGLHVLMRHYQSVTEGIRRLPLIGKRIGEKWVGFSGRPTFTEGAVHQLMGWSLLKYFFIVLRFYVTGLALGVSFPLLQTFFYMPFIQFFVILNLTPGGLGVVEVGSYGALKLMGVPEAKIMIFVVGQRIMTWCMMIGLALVSQLFFTLYLRIRKAHIE